MVYPPAIDKHSPEHPDAAAAWRVAEVLTVADLARILRELRRRHARRRETAELTYRELAAKTGWSHGIIGEYMSGRILPPTDRFDILIGLLGATAAEQGALATARDQVEENRRRAMPAEIPVPRQLPADVFGFTGRAGPLDELDAVPSVAVISGTAGVGKTALAVHWAHRAAERFPDGQLYLDLRGYDPEQPVSPADALAAFLRGLGVPGQDVPADPAERAARYRSTLSGRRVLVVLDNAYGADQVRPLLPGDPSCLTIVTSRDDLAGLVARDGARRVHLGTLTLDEALALLRTLVGARVDEAPEDAAALAECCARLPLALRIAAELVTANPDLPLSELLADLDEHRLDLLDAAGDPRTAVRSVFSWSYQHLSPPAARAFGLLGLHPGRLLDAYALAALADTTAAQARALMAELARGHLIEPSGHAMHDLLRAYAAERVSEGDAALTRLLDHYLATASAAMNTLFPYDPGRPEVAPARTPAPPVDRPELAARWLDQQRPNLVAAALHAARHGRPGHCVALSRTLWRHFEVGCHYQEALAVHGAAVQAARAGGQGVAAALADLGGVHWWMGDYRQALTHFEQSLAHARETDDRDGVARALGRLGVVHERLGDLRAALTHLGDARTAYRETGNRHGEAVQLVNLGALQRRLGDHAEAAEHLRLAAAVFAELGDLRLEGYALGNLGALHNLLGQYEEALAHLERALANCRETGDPGGEGSALAAIGTVHLRLERYPEALDHLRRALAISRDTGDRGLETETLNALGQTLLGLGEPEAALARHRSALALSEETGDRHEHARALDGLAQVFDATGDGDQARAHWRTALDIYDGLGVPEAERVRSRLSTGSR